MVSSVWLGGCSTIQEPSNDSVPLAQATWDDREAKLASIKSFDINAKIAIRDVKRNRGENANLDWHQKNLNYSLLLYGPMGSGSQKLSGRPGKVLLETSDGKKFAAKSPEDLLASQTGWLIPVSNLYYWVRGMPVPGLAAKKVLDKNNQLVQLSQGGWKINYLGYTSVNKMYMPRKIQLVNPNLSVKIVISRWKI